MFYELGCQGRIVLGDLPESAKQRLADLTGEWLEFDPPSGAIVVRLCQPSTSPCLATIAGELMRMLAELSAEEQANVPGGELYVHTEKKGELVRLRVGPGGVLEVRWARPDYVHARRAPYTGRESLVEAEVQRLNGCVSLLAAEPAKAARELEELALNYEGLYPGGDCSAVTDERLGKVQLQLREMNLDVHLLIARLEQLAVPGSLFGYIEVSSFAADDPEQCARFVFEDAKVWVERPVLWEEPAEPKKSVTPTAA